MPIHDRWSQRDRQSRGGARLGEEGSGAHQDHAREDSGQAREDQEWQAERRHEKRAPEGCARAETLHRTSGKWGDRQGREKHEIDEAKRHSADTERRLYQDKIHIGERADEGEQNAEAYGEACAQRRVPKVRDPKRRNAILRQGSRISCTASSR